ncbi:uncharacterized protein METZ01_LOCUS302688 [marine metagenome]|uniref:DUF507 domain-containing protein n=1 Tax=marine metagenome TaxID=408172 RepID=A0A382MLH9_9ZZZZ
MRISREKVNHISKIIVNDLEKREEFDYKAELNEIRLEITHVMNEFLKIEDQADEKARKICASYSKKLREGTDEWDILYNKHYEEHLSKHGL